MDGLIQRLDNDLKDGNSRIRVPIECIQGLCLVGNMKPDELAYYLLKSVNLFVRNAEAIYLVIPFFIGGVISGLNKQIRLYQKWK